VRWRKYWVMLRIIHRVTSWGVVDGIRSSRFFVLIYAWIFILCLDNLFCLDNFLVVMM
jgi:hypothetical protein